MSILATELTNLLPRSARRALRREYFARVATTALGLIVLALGIHAVLLLPAYMYAQQEASRQQAELDRLSADATSAGERNVEGRVAAVQADITYLSRLATLPTGSNAVRAIAAIPHPGIKLTGFTFAAPTEDGGAARMTVSGTSATRDSLRLYVESLGQLPYISKADLPISSYAKEIDIPFTITLSGTLTP